MEEEEEEEEDLERVFVAADDFIESDASDIEVGSINYFVFSDLVMMAHEVYDLAR